MTMPKRIQMSRQKPWREDNPDAVIVARPSKWGNPFALGHVTTIELLPARISMPILSGDVAPLDRDEAVRLFGYALGRQLFHRPGYPCINEIVAELRGRDLACWCPLDQPCHADVLLELANPKESTHEH